MLAQFAAVRAELPLYVVAEFRPEAGEWIPWHVHRTFDQNVAYVRAALAGKQIEAAAVAFDARSALGDLRRAYEAVWGAPLEPANFRRKILATPGFVEPTGGLRTVTTGRPAELYGRGVGVRLHPPLVRPR